jgi:5,5'-dehydrodivanillate O-demethylase oxygenase subunit
VYRAKDLAAGDTKPIRIMGEDFTLYRGETGIPHVVEFRCAHRGTQLSLGWVEDDCIRCFYHGWKYDTSGQCLEQPGEDPLFAQKIRIRTFPTKEYLGHIFVYFGVDAPPPLPRFPECEGPGFVEVLPSAIWPCNYFNRLDNAGDPVHVPFVHRESRRRAGINPEVRRVEPEETDCGIRYTRVAPDGTKESRHFFMPNVVQIFVPVRRELSLSAGTGPVTMIRLLWRVPVTDESSLDLGINYVPLAGEDAKRFQELRAQKRRGNGLSVEETGREILDGKLRIPDVEEQENYKLVLIEDYAAQVGQGSIWDRSKERLGRNDVAIILLRKIYERELRNLAEGQALKDWKLEQCYTRGPETV